jgi:hypothetical protein
MHFHPQQRIRTSLNQSDGTVFNRRNAIVRLFQQDRRFLKGISRGFADG